MEPVRTPSTISVPEELTTPEVRPAGYDNAAIGDHGSQAASELHPLVLEKPTPLSSELDGEEIPPTPRKNRQRPASPRRTALLMSLLILLLLVVAGSVLLIRQHNQSKVPLPTQLSSLELTGSDSNATSGENFSKQTLRVWPNFAVEGQASLNNGLRVTGEAVINGNMTVGGTTYATVADLGDSLRISGKTICTINGCLSSSSGGGLAPSLNGFTGSLTVQGTPNRLIVNNANGTITLTTPQDIAMSSLPTFGGLTLNGNMLISGGITTGFNCTGLLNGGALTTDNSGNIMCSADDGGSGGGVGSLNNLAGALSLQGTANQVSVTDNGTDTITLALPQAIAITASPTFNGLTLSGLADGVIHVSSGALVSQTVNLTSEISSVLPVANGGTALGTAPANGQLLIGNSTGYTLGTITNNGGITIVGGAGTLGLSVIYGNTINSAVQGNTTLICPAGTGNLTGGGTSITLGSGGSCSTLDTVTSPVFGGTLTVQGATLTVGSIVVQGSVVLNSGSGAGTNKTGTVLVDAILGQNTTYTLPDPGQASVTICLSTGNCAGAGGGITGSGTSGALSKFTASGTIGGSTLSESGTTVTASGTLVIQGSNALTLGLSGPSGTDGALVFRDAAGTHTVTLQAPASDPAANLVFKLPSAYGTNGDCLQSDGSGGLSFATCTGGAGGGVTSLNSQTGVVTLANASAVSGTITINNASTAAKGIAQFNSTNFSAAAGVINTIQDIAASSSPTFSGLTLSSLSTAGVVHNNGSGVLSSGDVTLGSETTGGYVATLGSLTGLSTTGNSGEGSSPTLAVLYGSGANNAAAGNNTFTCTSGTGNLTGGGTTVTIGTSGTACAAVNTVNNPTFSTSVTAPLLNLTGAGSTGTLQVANLGQATTYTIPDPGAGAATVCLSTGNCAGAGGGITGSGSSGALAVFTGSGTIGNAIITQSGTTGTVGGNLIVDAASGFTGNLLDLQLNAGSKFRVDQTGAATLANGLTVNAGGLTVTGSSTIAGTLSSLTGLTSSGTITLSGLNTAGVVHNNASGVLSTSAVLLGTDTSGNYVANLGSLTGLSTTGNSGAGSTPTLTVLYGSTANTAVQGNTSLTCASGTGNLTGGGTSITLGSGGSCASLDTVANPTFATSVTTPSLLSSAGLSITAAAASNITLGSTATSGNITVGAAATTGTITVGQATSSNTINIGTAIGASNTQTLNLGTSSTGTTNVTVGSTAAGTTLLQGAAITLNPTTSGTITLGNASGTGTLTVGRSTISNTINIGTAIGASNTQAINIGTSATANSTTNVTIGSTADASATALQAGTAGITAFTVATTGTGLAVSSDQVTTGTGTSVSVNSLTTGSGLQVTSSSALLSSGTLGQISQTSTYNSTVSSVSANVLSVSRTLTSTLPSGITQDASTPSASPQVTSVSPGGSSSPLTWSHNVGYGSNRVLIVNVAISVNTDLVTNVTWTVGSTVQTLTRIAWAPGSTARGTYMYYVVNPTSGLGTVSVSTSSNTSIVAGSSSWYNVDPVTPFRTGVDTGLPANNYKSVGGGSTAATLTLSGTATTDKVIDSLVTTGLTQPSITGGQSALWNNAAATVIYGASSQKAGTAASTTVSYSLGGSSTNYGFIAVAMKSIAPELKVTGSVASFTNQACTANTTCTDSASVLSLSQNYTAASGAVLNILGAGSGNLAALDATNASANGLSIDIQSSSSSQYAFKVTSNNGSTNLIYAQADGKVGIGTATPGNLLSLGVLTTADTAGQLAVTTGGVNNKGIVIQGVASQNADLFQAQDSTGAVLASISKAGNLTVVAATFNGNVTIASGQTIKFAGTGNAQNALSKNFICTVATSAGDLVVIDTANPGQLTTTATGSSTLVAGVVVTGAGAGGTCEVALSGVVQVTMTTAGAVSVGDLLETGTTAGQGRTAVVATTGAIFGKALSAKTGGSAGTVWVLLNRF